MSYVNFPRVSVFVTVFGVYVARNEIKHKAVDVYRSVLSQVVQWSRRPPSLNNHYLRSEFRNLVLPRMSVDDPAHSHPASAAWRSSATVLARDLSARVGLQPYVYQAGSIDVRDGLSYCRSYYWMKDVCVPTTNSEPHRNSLLVVVDVDYYVDVPQLLLQHDNPVLLYTFQPTTVALASGEFSFRFSANNDVVYNVSGGANYEHKVWNYGKDVVTVSSFYKSRSYIIERRQANPHHEYVLLIPIGTWYWAFSWISRLLNSDRLDYLRVNNGDFNLMDVKTKDGVVRSLARVGHYNCANTPIETFNAIEAVSKTSKIMIGNATVQSWIEGNRPQAAVITDYLRSSVPSKPPFVYPPAEGIRHYQIIKRVEEVDHQSPLMVSYMSPVLPNTFVPTRSITNEEAAVTGRIKLPQQEARELAVDVKSNDSMSRMLIDEMEKFVEFLIPHPHACDPVEIEDVYEKQNRPTQRGLLEAAESKIPDRQCTVFLKAEPYQKVSDPRIITTYNTVDKREYSRFTYAITRHLNKTGWYSFGKTPLQIATSVAKICSEAVDHVNCADASRMDGHIHANVRLLERMILLRYFKVEHHATLIDLHGAQYNCRASTRLGVRYKIEDQRGSGSPETALFNTIVSKFIDYLARRLDGVIPTKAYYCAGEFGGDDSISPDVSGSKLVQAGAIIGQVLENVMFKRGASGVNYLSRFYTVDVWFGSNLSTCDLPRALSKLHVTPMLPSNVTPINKLEQKLSGLFLTDRYTPIIMEILDAAERLGLKIGQISKERSLVSWWARYEKDVNWPNEPCDDPDAWLDQNMPDIDVKPLFQYLLTVNFAHELLCMPTIFVQSELPINNKALVHIDDEIKAAPKVSAPTEKLQPICTEYVKGKCTYGRNCKYKHAKVCRDYLMNRCSRKRCMYPHIDISQQ